MKPFAWAYRKGPDKFAEISTNRAWHYGMQREFGGEVIPLYRSPSLTPAEREAVEFCDEWLREMACRPGAIAPQILGVAATLRGLLERLG